MNGINWFHYAAPQRFYPLAGRLIPWFGALAALLTAAGLYIGLWLAPTDAQQGEAYRIIFVHVPAAWMSMVVYLAMAAWAGVDAFDLLAATWGGSGYDVACGQAGGPILYQRLHGRSQWVEIPFRPAFAEQLWFVYLGQKQDSREGIHRYRERSERITSSTLDEIGALTLAAAAAVQLADFEKIMTEHERIIGSLLGLEPVQQSRFSD